MLLDQDHYEAYYSGKLWNLIPAIYRALDTDNYGVTGPLQAMVNRFGAQAAVLRRSLDRLWEDQSIESCDDWLVPYIGDLLLTRLVSSQNPRGQRLDVAKTIYYRRRKGTVGLIEELANDITGWEARVVEFFRRLGRTRHLLDPSIGPWVLPTTDMGQLQRAEGLIGVLSRTGIGGTADNRNVAGASKVGTAFDEYFYTADVRMGQGRTGWYNIPHLGIFLWRLISFGVPITNPVPIKGCPGHYTFDPMGREIALFAWAERQENRAYGDLWVSPDEWQLPTPISKALLQSGLDDPTDYPLWATTDAGTGQSEASSLGVYRKPGIDYIAVDVSHAYTDPNKATADAQGVLIYPELGRFKVEHPPAGDVVFTTYHYGFSSTIGAGPYDRRDLGDPAIPDGAVVGGGAVLQTALAAATATDFIGITDSLTYTSVKDVSGTDSVSIRASNEQRPVIRLTPGTVWTFTGNTNSQLTLDGLFIGGCDIVLAGQFDLVTINCCTLDPGNWDEKANKLMTAADGAALQPCHLRIQAQVRELDVTRSIVGPILVEGKGDIETVSITESIVQAIGTDNALTLATGDLTLQTATVLGPAQIHRLYASDSILGGAFTAEDTQHGCVRFSAYTEGSAIPSPYESVEIGPNASLFNSEEFGDGSYGQIREGVDTLILSGPPMRTISAGAEDGSEMGVFGRDHNPQKAESLVLKLEEYMPLGLVPVLIYAT